MTLRYDYAWQTPGWSAQNPTFEGPSDGYADPGMPEDVSRVHLFGSFLEFDTGRSLEGVLRLRVDRTLLHVPSNQPVMGGAMRTHRFTRYRPLSLWLPATDDPDLSPAFQYEAKLTVRGKKYEFKFSLPSAVPEVNISTLMPSETGDIEITDGDGNSNDVALGSVPQHLTINVVEGADFRSVLTMPTAWNPASVVTLRFANGEVWTATLSGADASFYVDKVDAAKVPKGTGVRLVVTTGTDDQVWAAGSVVRHG